MRFGPCDDWTTAEAIEADKRYCVPEGETVDLADYAHRATEAMWVLTGRRFGVCTATVRPVRSGCANPCAPSSYGTEGILLHDPLVSVDSVTIDGAPFADYHVRNGRTIHRSDHKAWPSSQDLGKPTTETGTFSITYTFGVDPPLVVAKATTELAVQYMLLDQASANCQLPMGTTTATYQGLTVDMQRAMESSAPLIQNAVNSYPMGAGAPSDIWGGGDWELVIVSA